MPTAKDIFDQRVPEALAATPEKGHEIGAVFLFRVTGAGGGTWTVDLTGNPPTCKSGEIGQAQCTIDVADSDFERILANPELSLKLYFEGRLRVTGDPRLATRLKKVLSILT